MKKDLGTRCRAQREVREWNDKWYVGVVVLFGGEKHRTESPAGLDMNFVPCVFISNVDHPVPLTSLRVNLLVEDNV